MIDDGVPLPAGALERAERRAEELVAFARGRFGDDGAASAMLVAAARMVALEEGEAPGLGEHAAATFGGLVALYGGAR